MGSKRPAVLAPSKPSFYRLEGGLGIAGGVIAAAGISLAVTYGVPLLSTGGAMPLKVILFIATAAVGVIIAAACGASARVKGRKFSLLQKRERPPVPNNSTKQR